MRCAPHSLFSKTTNPICWGSRRGPESSEPPDAEGKITLSPDAAETTGKVGVEQRGGQPNFGFWDNSGDSVSWTVRFPATATYRVKTSCASTHGDAAFILEAAGQSVSATATKTADWDDFRAIDLGTLKVEHPGVVQVRVRPKDPASWNAINLRTITLVPE